MSEPHYKIVTWDSGNRTLVRCRCDQSWIRRVIDAIKGDQP